jgi:outer membrane immunogenic protein
MLRAFAFVALLMSGPAAASEFLSPKPVASWTGFYGGINAGGAWGTVSKDSVFNAPIPPYAAVDVAGISSTASQSLNTSGFTGGVQVGYNLQQGSIVWGVESDFQYLGLKGSNSITSPFPSTPASSYTVATSVSTDWLFTARGRLGWTVRNLLLYGTAGFAVGHQKFTQTITLLPPFVVSNSGSDTRIGWTVGAGAEYALDPDWSIKAEYLYVDLGKPPASTGTINPASAGVFDQTSAHLTFGIARLGVNRRF